jgi:ATP-dependent DNA ligase
MSAIRPNPFPIDVPSNCPGGVVSKRRDRAYKSGRSGDRVKVKCAGWRDANEERCDCLSVTASFSAC